MHRESAIRTSSADANSCRRRIRGASLRRCAGNAPPVTHLQVNTCIHLRRLAIDVETQDDVCIRIRSHLDRGRRAAVHRIDHLAGNGACAGPVERERVGRRQNMVFPRVESSHRIRAVASRRRTAHRPSWSAPDHITRHDHALADESGDYRGGGLGVHVSRRRDHLERIAVTALRGHSIGGCEVGAPACRMRPVRRR